MESEEGDTIAPITGEIEPNFANLEEDKKKKIRNQILLWGGASLAVIVIVIVIIVLVLNRGSGEDEKKDVYGSITCIYEVESGEIDILSEYFEKPFDLTIYVGRAKIGYTKKYNFAMEDSKTLRFDIHTKEVSLENMFKGVKNLKIVY